jgi:hypothetical protein
MRKIPANGISLEPLALIKALLVESGIINAGIRIDYLSFREGWPVQTKTPANPSPNQHQKLW